MAQNLYLQAKSLCGLSLLALLLFFSLLASKGIHAQQPQAEAGWPTYGGDPGGQRYTAATQINRKNIRDLKPAWTFHTGVKDNAWPNSKLRSFEATPILFQGKLYLSTPYDQVFALNPETGEKLWSYDPQLDWTRDLGIITSRGVASWSAETGDETSVLCGKARIFLGTLDGRLIALDALQGVPCPDFGRQGTVLLTDAVDYRKGDNYSLTSPVAVVGDVVIAGSGIGDNSRVDIERGLVRGLDARSGRVVWTWDPMPWAEKQTPRTGAGNTWAAIATDPEHGIVYLSTSSPSPDYYGGLRPGDNRSADSLVALDAKTGRKIWDFQAIHHDLWDYDIAAEPLLFTFHKNVPAVAITTKVGTLFAFNRLTGEPLYPITERPVPQSDVPGETASPTQPFSALPSFVPITFDSSQRLGVTSTDDAECRALLSHYRYSGVFTPPSLQGTLLYPSNVGGVNWGSMAYDPQTGVVYANNNRIPYVVKLSKRPPFEPRTMLMVLGAGGLLLLLIVVATAGRWGGRTGLVLASVCAIGLTVWLVRKHEWIFLMADPHGSLGYSGNVLVAAHFKREYGPNRGTPYVLLRDRLIASSGHPCAPQPFGAIGGINLETGKPAWTTPLGTMVEGLHTGTWSVGGPMVMAGGLVVTAASDEPYLRAFDSSSGEELWKVALPYAAQATPMSYTIHGRQYIVICAGGHGDFGTQRGDAVVALALPTKVRKGS